MTEAVAPISLRRNRDFMLLWIGQLISAVGNRVVAVAFPLLVLGTTHSPAKAGITGFAEMLPALLFTLYAGALLDRVDRRRVMLASEAARTLALGSLAVAVAAGHVSFAHILVVAFVDGTGYIFFELAERAALSSVVPREQVPDAIAANQGRVYGTGVLGTPLGGFLFGLARAVPFAVDAVSYFVSLMTVAAVRTPLQEERAPGDRPHVVAEIRDGLRFVWKEPFLRATSLIAAGSDFVINALVLVVIVAAKRDGASSFFVGVMLAFYGLAGLLGAVIAPRASRALSVPAVIIGTEVLVAGFTPVLAVVHGAIALGIVFGAMFLAWPTWNAVVMARKLAITPDQMRGRMTSVSTMFSLGSTPLGMLGAGFLLESIGVTKTVLVFTAMMAVVLAGAITSRAVRSSARNLGEVPELPQRVADVEQ
jgi:MFS family permease